MGVMGVKREEMAVREEVETGEVVREVGKVEEQKEGERMVRALELEVEMVVGVEKVLVGERVGNLERVELVMAVEMGVEETGVEVREKVETAEEVQAQFQGEMEVQKVGWVG